jgi:hypothetical protein
VIEIEIKTEPWVRGWVQSLFSQRGIPLDDSQEIIGLQWENWKRLLFENGLIQNQRLASQVAYSFSTHRVIGGAGRIFEHFAAFIAEKPAELREEAEARYEIPDGHKCRICDNLGVVMVPVVRHKDGEIRRTKKAFACTCEIGKNRYSGLIMINSEIADARLAEEKIEFRNACDWLESRGLPRKPTFAEFWQNLLKRDQPKASKIRPEQNEQRLSLQAYYNGDERSEWQ